MYDAGTRAEGDQVTIDGQVGESIFGGGFHRLTGGAGDRAAVTLGVIAELGPHGGLVAEINPVTRHGGRRSDPPSRPSHPTWASIHAADRIAVDALVIRLGRGSRFHEDRPAITETQTHPA